MRKIVFSMVLVLSLFLKAFEARIQSEETPVQGESQNDLFKRFFLVVPTVWNDFKCEEQIKELKQLKADAMVLLDFEETDPGTVRVGDPFFIVKNESRIVTGTLIEFFSSCEFGRVGLLRLKEKDWAIPENNGGTLAFAHTKPALDVLGSVKHLDEKSARQYLSMIEPKIPKYYGDVHISAVRFVPPRSHEKYLLVSSYFFETKEDYNDAIKSSNRSGFLFRLEGKEMVLLEQVSGLADITGITDLDSDGVYEVLVLIGSGCCSTLEMRLFDGKVLSKSKRIMVEGGD